ncbi:DNA binding domain-containing protein, excisionase family [Ruminococcaceae bacterium KH2T8]|nr:DNA binding domain-containing protein, excisionase family [Ruminococcaceae bacterium KH2T8]
MDKEIKLFVDQPTNTIIKQDVATSYIIEMLKKKEKDSEDKMNLSTLNEKKLLSVDEAAELFGIGRHKIRELTNDKNCPYALWIGGHRKIKREAFEEFVMNNSSI